MANFYTDTPELKFHLNHPLMKRIVELKERNFTEKDKYDYAPLDFEDTMDSYDKVLEIVGEICGDIIAPNAEGVDHEGPEVVNNRVKYASGTVANLDATRKAGLMGMAMPRRYNGLNFPIVPYIMAADIVSRADAGFENLWGLQDCAETLYEFGSEDQRERFIPRICAGETMSMDLTEPDAGSDLQSVMLKATYSEADGCWLLNGVKRFITNGDADIHLVLARSEEGTKDGRGLSMFIYDKKQGGVNVRRIENKMGIKGSPTCELVYKNAKAELCGDRKLGLIKYVMALMNGARLGIAAQSVGLSQAAYNEALAYAQERMQFGKAIIKFAAVQEILSVMKAKLDASRALLYETARFVDMYKVLEDIQRERKLDPEERTEMKKYSKLADAFTPLAKGLSSEYANQNAYDAIQIHGGSGFMKDYACERIYRDARITSIYEGTTQLQVVAAIRHVTTGTYLAQLRTYAEKSVKPELEPLKTRLIALTDLYEKTVASVVDTKNNEY
ncbi:MAG: acyl-CoA dehydrogenase family protein, partial [Bacteroidales bacterium]